MKRIDFVGVSIISLLFTSSLFLSIHIEADPDPEKDGNDNSLIFSRSLNLTENSIWHRNLAIADINNNSYPDIFSGPRYIDYFSPFNKTYPYKDGIFFYEVSKGNIECRKSSFNKYDYSSFNLINLYSDNNMDFFNHNQYYENNEGEIIIYPSYFIIDESNIHYPFTPGIGDINSDGYYDMIYSFSYNGFDTALCNKNNTWNISGWESGLKFKRGTHEDPWYISNFENSLNDINNDGWLDICSGMGNGGTVHNDECPMVYYNWVSDGSGNWSLYSKGFPKYQHGINIDLADLDNDGDLDFGLLTPDEFYILENTGMNDWKILNETFPDRIKSFSFEDIDLDGYQDLVYYKTDSFNKTHKRNELWIGYGDGNWNWDLQKQTTIISGYPGEMYLKDIDLDGDKDLINTFSYSDDPDNTNPQEFYTGGIYCVFNDLNNSPSLRFTETLTNPHVRSGSVYRLEWSGKDAWRYADTTQSFNLSISYTGENGTYHRLKSNIPMWWTELIIPDTPSENAYLKIEWNGYDATSGPFVIHDKEDRTRLIKPSFPKDGDYLIGGEEMDIALNTSVSLGPTDVDIIIHHDNGSYDLGSHRLGSDGVETVSWTVPDNVKELNCSLQVEFQWDGASIDYTFEDKFGIIPGDLVPRSMDINRLRIPRDINKTFQLSVYTNDGLNISDRCNYHVDHDEDLFDSWIMKNGSIKFRGYELGTYPVTFRAERYGFEIAVEFDIEVCKDLNHFTLSSPLDTYHVSEPFTVEVTAYDSHMDVYDVTDEPIHVATDLDSEIDSSNLSEVRVKPLEPGSMNFTVYTDLGLGNVSENLTLDILSFFRKTEMNTADVDLYEGDSTMVSVDVERYDLGSLDDVNITWTVTGPASFEKSDRQRIEITATSFGEINVYCNVSAYSEVVTLHQVINSDPFMDRIELETEEISLEVSESTDVNFSVIDSAGAPFEGSYSVSLSIDDPSVVTADVKDNYLHIMSGSEGVTNVTVTSTYGDRSVEYVLVVEVLRIPRRLELEDLDIIKKGGTAELDVSVYDIRDLEMSDYDYVLNGEGVLASFDDGTITMEADEIGPGNVTLSVFKHGYELSKTIEFRIIHDAEAIVLDRTDIELYPGDVEFLPVSLLDMDGRTIPDATWTLSEPRAVSASFENGEIEITAVRIGSGRLGVTAEYHGEEFTSGVNITVKTPRVLTRIELVEIDENKVMVYAFDQEGEDITHLCDIEWIGDVENRNENTTIGSGKITVRVSYEDKILEDSIVLGDDESNGIDPLLVAIPVLIVIIIGAGLFLFIRKPLGKDSKKEIPEKSE